MSANNFKRIFIDVVSLDAWHKPFDEKCTISDLHVDVAFVDRARLGGEEESKVRFHLSIKKAEIHVIVPPGELVEVLPDSVVRSAPPILRGKQTTTIARKQQTEGSAKGSLALSNNGASATGETTLSANLSVARGDSTEIQREIELMGVMHTQVTRGHHRWALEPDIGESVLYGRRWDAVKEPRLKLRDLRKSSQKSFDPIVYIEARCLRDDLKIEDIELKDESKWQRLSRRLGQENRIAAAESYIRNRLAKFGIEVSPHSVHEKFSEILIAQIAAIPSNTDEK